MPRKYNVRRKKSAPRRRKARAGKLSTGTKVELYAQYKMEGAWSVAPSTVAPVGQYGYTSYSLFNGATQNITNQPEFAAQRLMYDEFCVTKLKVTYTPTVTENTVGNVPNSAATNLDMYTWIDRDGKLPVSTAVNIPLKVQAYDSFRKYSLLKPFTRTISAKKMWIDSASAAIDPRSQLGLAQPYTNAGLFQILALYAQNLPFANGVQLGTIKLEWTVQFRGKVPVTYSTLPDGSLVITRVDQFDAELDPLNVVPPPHLENSVVCVEGVIQVVSEQDGSIAGQPIE